MSIRNARFIGKYTPPKNSEHHHRSKRVFVGTDSATANPVRYYERDGKNIEIDPKEWPKWRKSRPAG